MTRKPRFGLAIFDWDGTLFRSIDLIENSIVAAGEATGYPIKAAVARSTIGLGLKASLDILFPNDKVDDAFLKRFHLAYRRHYDWGEKEISLYDGAYDLIRDLYRAGAVLAVATAKSRSGIDRSLRETGLHEFVSHSRTPEECEAKPHPQMVNEILHESGLARTDAVMVGDTIHDLKMGINAQVAVVGLSHGAFTEGELLGLNPLAVCEDIQSLRGVLF